MPSIVTDSWVYIQTRFVASHRWRNAPDEFPLLRHFHRHEFHVRICKEVTHDNRQIEFIRLKREVDEFIRQNWKDRTDLELSCEQFAGRLLIAFDASMVDVSEDGENGAVVMGHMEDE